jgi:hypothetical protein
LSLPDLGLVADISFLVDTGADRSILMPIDAIRMGLDYSALSANLSATGVGGSVRMYAQDASIAFLDGRKRIRLYEIALGIVGPTHYNRRTPSLLGRDIIDRWRMSYNPSKDRLTFTVMSADQTVDA